MARPIRSLLHGRFCEVRSGSGGVIVADNAVLTDANIDPTLVLDCWGFDTIFVGVEITAGTNPTMTIEPLFRDEDAADANGGGAGCRWKRLAMGARDGFTLAAALAAEDSGALAPDALPVELRVYGHRKVFLRIKAVANPTSTTGYKIIAMPGRRRDALIQQPW